MELQWPAIVMTLEREWGNRFERLARALAVRPQDTRYSGGVIHELPPCGGRTLVLTLAGGLARRPCRTLVIDADLTGPMLARMLGLRPEVGLDDVVENDQALSSALIDATDDHLAVLPMRASFTTARFPGESCVDMRAGEVKSGIRLDSDRWRAALQRFEAAVLHRSVDAAILVHHRGVTGERAILLPREVLDAGGIPLLGLAETFV